MRYVKDWFRYAINVVETILFLEHEAKSFAKTPLWNMYLFHRPVKRHATCLCCHSSLESIELEHIDGLLAPTSQPVEAECLQHE